MDIDMKTKLIIGIMALAALSAGAVTVHRSFRNGYPSGSRGVTVRSQPNAAVLKAPRMRQGGVKVVTNRVVITKEQAEKLLKAKKAVKKPAAK